MQQSFLSRSALVVAVALLCAGCGESTNPNGPKQLGITLNQLTTTAGANLSIQVAIQDASGTTVAGSTAPVTLALGTNLSSATLLGTLTVNAVNGVATFTDIHITKAAQGYTLAAFSPGLPSATSPAFQIVAGPAIEIEFVTPPASTVTAGAALAPAIQVAVHDQYDNTVTTATGGATITLEPNAANATLSGTTTAAFSAGVATFANLTINKTSPGLQLKATSGTFLPVLTSPFAVSAGAAAKLAFGPLGTTFESGTFLGETVGFNIHVRILDANDNLVTSANNSVTIAIGTNPGSGTLAGSLTRAAFGGDAEFSAVSIDKVGSGYTLVASATGLQNGTSTAFAITPGTPTQISWSLQPGPNADPGITIPAFKIALLDAAGNVATGRQGYYIQLTLASGPSGGKLVGSGFANEGGVVDGFATFTGYRFDHSGTYTIRATMGNFPPITSNPVAVAPVAFSKVSVGGGPAFSFPITQSRHTCALTTLSVAYCWGSGIWGATGLSPANSIVDAFDPQLVATTQRFKDIDAGNLHTCAITLAGAAYCWGSDLNGGLGDADPNNGTKASPVAVSGGLTFVSISAGDRHTCGIVPSGAGALSGPAYCWGYNASGQLGDGTFSERNVPTLVAGGLTFIAVSASPSEHTCGITTNFMAYCWGLNIDGQLGDASTTTRNVPTLVQDAATHLFRSISTGRFHTCAVRADNATYCWGANTSQQLGDGNTAQTDRTAPSLSTSATSAVSGGWLHTCGIAAAGGAICWGANDAGQLGDGGTTERNASAPVSGSLGITRVSSGQDFSCGVTADNKLYCWGLNEYGQLGDGTTTQRLTPVRVLP